nr:acetate/propionate family kinase [uncultured Gellertiella sp.]
MGQAVSGAGSRDAQSLAVNCGSSSVKLALFDADLNRIGEAEASRIGTAQPVTLRFSGLEGLGETHLPEGASHEQALSHMALAIADRHATRLCGIGHRVVHGGSTLRAPHVIDARLLQDIEALTPLAPLHQPHCLTGIHLLGQMFAHLPQVACFDTGFHRSIPEQRQLYGLPLAFADQGLRAYGFHGLSCEHVVSRFAALTGRTLPSALVICHLGNGASVTGLRDGQSRCNSMGFTPIDGLIMGQRCGHLDPGAVLWLVDAMKGDTAAVSDLLNRHSGLLGLSGESSDMRALLAMRSPAAHLALDMFVDRIVRETASAAGAIGGLDALVFTGGIGSGAPAIRQRVIDGLAWLGFVLDPEANTAHAATITSPHSARSAHVILADEERVICRAVMDLVSGGPEISAPACLAFPI